MDDFDGGLDSYPKTTERSSRGPKCPTCGIGVPLRKSHRRCLVCHGKSEVEIEELKQKRRPRKNVQLPVAVEIFLLIIGALFFVAIYMYI